MHFDIIECEICHLFMMIDAFQARTAVHRILMYPWLKVEFVYCSMLNVSVLFYNCCLYFPSIYTAYNAMQGTLKYLALVNLSVHPLLGLSV